MENQSEAEAEPSGVVTVVVGIVVVSTLNVAPWGRETTGCERRAGGGGRMQAASTEFVVIGVDPRVTLDGALPVSAPPSMPPAPRAPYPLLQSIGADAPLRSLLRRDFEGVVHCAHAQAQWAREQMWAQDPLAACEALAAGARVSSGNSLAETVQSASPYVQRKQGGSRSRSADALLYFSCCCLSSVG